MLFSFIISDDFRIKTRLVKINIGVQIVDIEFIQPFGPFLWNVGITIFLTTAAFLPSTSALSLVYRDLDLVIPISSLFNSFSTGLLIYSELLSE